MSCCGTSYEGGHEVVGDCPKCGAEVNDKGEALDSCSYSEMTCMECGEAPCDGAC